ncbi:hypothetical protein IV203_006492 [Nitzschia inconspicua]|uniref:Uncharacterized protein n=1 Tax=Nitzschia inconspicua TaxID=303405 RepID=A0A9K3P9G4_9STRA|nr:hypothetical protein IV203_006641 [Nitzschia inconspicua]KAG7340088.1 hypothetical protein IV203_006492 [Nitzschia inconspicua]
MASSAYDELRQPFLPLHSEVEQNDPRPRWRDDTSTRDAEESASLASSSPSVLSQRYLALVKRAKKNVKRTLALTFLAFASRTMWSQAPLSIFITLVWTQHLEYVGYATAIVGLCQVASSALARFLLQRFQLFNTPFLVGTSILGILATVVSTYTIFWIHYGTDDGNRSALFLFLSMGLWGMVWGVSESILPVVFSESDSLVETKSFQMCSRLIRIGTIVGNALVLGLFYTLGNEWTIVNCAVVVMVGLFLNLQVFFLLCSLRMLPLDLDYDDDVDDTESFNDPVGDGGQLVFTDMPLEEESMADVENDDVTNDVGQTKRCYFWTKVGGVLILITASEILSAFAGGMSIRYFPVYFVKSVGLDPLRVQLLYLLVPAGQWLSPMMVAKLAQCSGPLRASIGVQWVFVSLLVSMIALQAKGAFPWVVSIMYIMHGSLLNSTSSLIDMIVAQNFPDGESSKLRMANALQLLLWSAGAAFGGYVAGHYGMHVNFYITGAVQLGASIPLLVLYCVKPGDDILEMEDRFRDYQSISNINDYQQGQDYSSSQGSVVFQDCLSEMGSCKEERCYCSQATSPGISDTTSDTHSITSSDHDVMSTGSL